MRFDLVSFMHIPRFYISEPLAVTDTYLLPQEAAHHALRVLRLQVGDHIQLFDGTGVQYPATIQSVDGRQCQVSIVEASRPVVEPALSIHLGQALLPADKMDWLIQKSVELGVSRVTPLKMKRCVVQLDQERGEKKRHHWQGVMVAAAEQSGRVRVPVTEAPQTLLEWIGALPAALPRYLLDPAVSGSAPLGPQDAVALVIGPEGGFDDEERRQLRAADFRSVRLGPRVLRSETAALAALTAFQLWCGDFK
jgi:16S rRNA (uracil1498-N3)-methyltransferase